ncbi:MAG: DNA mismatch repair protein MutS [Cyclobacteriaceae bacterium]
MSYLILALIAIILVFIITRFYVKHEAKKKLDQIRSKWAKVKAESFHFDSIKKYAGNATESEFHSLTDQTIADVELYDLFAFIDRTTSKVGQQFLYNKIVKPRNNVDTQSEKLIHLFTHDTKLREKAQLELHKLSDSDAYQISNLLKDELLDKPKWFKWLAVDVTIVIILFILSIKFPVLLIALIIPFSLNVFLHFWNKSNTFKFVRSFPQLDLLINASKVLSKNGDLCFDESVPENIMNLRSFQRKAMLIKFDSGSGFQSELSQLVNYVFELIKAFFLIEVFVLHQAIKELRNRQSDIANVFNYVGIIDSSISIASLRAGEYKTCQPVFMPAKKELEVNSIYHPLVENCVRNSLSIRGKSILITGSNMSGKSTFLKTLIINSILAQTINTCFADEYLSPTLKQFSSIRIDDDLFTGRSYYFQEVSVMASLIEKIDTPHQNLFILDEVFKGTNTVERISAAKGILSYLNSGNNIVIVSTHDVELVDMLSDEYDLYHFTETIENNELHFDHAIRSGALKTRNAIKILELSNYPAAIVKEAMKVSATFDLLK